MNLILILTLLLVGVLLTVLAQRSGKSRVPLQWAGFASTLAAVGIAIWTVMKMMGDHQR